LNRFNCTEGFANSQAIILLKTYCRDFNSKEFRVLKRGLDERQPGQLEGTSFEGFRLTDVTVDESFFFLQDKVYSKNIEADKY
jgi:hypothetical protein